MQKSLLAAFGACILLLVSVLMFAQATQSAAPSKSANTDSANPARHVMTDQDMEALRADTRDQRRKLTAANMVLTPEQASKFWPIYEQYINETIKIKDERWSLIKSYNENYSNMTDEVAQDYIDRSADVDQRLLALRLKYVSIFKNAVPIKTAAQWYQVDRRLELLIDVQQGSIVPVVNNTK